MVTRSSLEKRIARKESDIAKLKEDFKKAETKYEDQLGKEESYLQALHDIVKLTPKEIEGKEEVPFLRSGSLLSKVKNILLKAGAPLHVDVILERLGLDKTKKSIISGSLASYARRGRIFTRPFPNTYGLKEFNQSTNDLQENINKESNVDK